jgi:hypothetical protein
LPEPNSSEGFGAYVPFPTDVIDSELDCLNLFIERPSATALARLDFKNGSKLPVLIWIHGGGYGFGAGTDPMWGKWDELKTAIRRHYPSMLSCGRSYTACHAIY